MVCHRYTLLWGSLVLICTMPNFVSSHKQRVSASSSSGSGEYGKTKPKPPRRTTLMDVAIPTAEPMVVMPEPEPDQDICFGQPDGDYAKSACENEYYSCVANSKIVRYCPGKLVFDAYYTDCADKSKSKGCTGKDRPAPEDLPVVSTYPPLSDFDCSHRADGLYANPLLACDSAYYACSGGKGHKLACIASLYFDTELQVCDVFDNVEACSGKKRTPSPEPEVWTAAMEVPVDFDCSDLPDGNHPDPNSAPTRCSHVYYACFGGKARQLECYGNLFYDPDNDLCDLNEFVVACGGQPRPQLPVPVTSEPAVSAFDCSNLEDGFYANPDEQCSAAYYSCAGGFGRILACPDGLVFEPESLSCEPRDSAFVCTGVRPTSPLPEDWTAGPTFPRVNADFDCRNHADGLYPDDKQPCSHRYFACTAGCSVEKICPLDLYFDPELSVCNRFEDTFVCSGHRPTPYVPVENEPASRRPQVYDCSDKLDGLYANPESACSNFYYVCSNKVSDILFCADGLFFDSENNGCDRYVNVFACSGLRPRTVTPAAPHEPVTFAPIDFDCTGKADGDYADHREACSSIYYTCFGGIGQMSECPATNLVFDPELDLCEVREKVPVCGGIRPLPEDIPIVQPAGKLTPFPHCSCHFRVPLSLEQPFDCSKLQDGNYGSSDCDNLYYSCVGGAAFPIHCPSDLFYDIQNNVCDWKQFIVKCGGAPRPATPAEQPQPQAEPEPEPEPEPRLRRHATSTSASSDKSLHKHHARKSLSMPRRPTPEPGIAEPAAEPAPRDLPAIRPPVYRRTTRKLLPPPPAQPPRKPVTYGKRTTARPVPQQPPKTYHRPRPVVAQPTTHLLPRIYGRPVPTIVRQPVAYRKITMRPRPTLSTTKRVAADVPKVYRPKFRPASSLIKAKPAPASPAVSAETSASSETTQYKPKTRDLPMMRVAAVRTHSLVTRLTPAPASYHKKSRRPTLPPPPMTRPAPPADVPKAYVRHLPASPVLPVYGRRPAPPRPASSEQSASAPASPEVSAEVKPAVYGKPLVVKSTPKPPADQPVYRKKLTLPPTANSKTVCNKSQEK
uniref:Chitin-binding type-2 domain-containing protein n=1 Tax=Romanomermis culicivorax TaxID=13658 RepID=A0A915IPL8_ROMCU